MVLSILNLGARHGWEVNTMPQPLYPRARDVVPIVQEAVWAFLGLVVMGLEISLPPSTGVRTLYCPANSKSLMLSQLRITDHWKPIFK
jgi:hypothetical protein